jgi:dCMP deaminase
MRKDYLKWDEYFMSVAILSGLRSKDPSTQVGACIVNDQNHIVGTGYNGMPKGTVDSDAMWQKDGDYFETKYPYVVHAEQNAILNTSASIRGARIYVSLFPCHECAKYIIQSGIDEVVYMEDKYAETDSVKASKKMLDAAEVTCRQIEKIGLTVEKGEHAL